VVEAARELKDSGTYGYLEQVKAARAVLREALRP